MGLILGAWGTVVFALLWRMLRLLGMMGLLLLLLLLHLLAMLLVLCVIMRVLRRYMARIRPHMLLGRLRVWIVDTGPFWCWLLALMHILLLLLLLLVVV